MGNFHHVFTMHSTVGDVTRVPTFVSLDTNVSLIGPVDTTLSTSLPDSMHPDGNL